MPLEVGTRRRSGTRASAKGNHSMIITWCTLAVLPTAIAAAIGMERRHNPKQS
jgi:hypothetical protein